MLTLLTDPRCLDHLAPPGMPEKPERLRGILEELRQTSWHLTEAVPDIDPVAVASLVHEEKYIERFRKAVERGDGLIDSADNPLSAATWSAATGAVAASLAGAEQIVSDSPSRAFVAVRPPGHHAEYDKAMGFCYFNNIAIAAQHLITKHGLEKVAIVDFDVHHGNGTQHLFEERADVFFVSLHQFPFYPGTGAASETGRGSGAGATLNVPMEAGCGDEEYERAFGDQVLPALRDYGPQALLISAGFDAWKGDPLGGMKVSAQGYADWGRWLRDLAEETCDGRVLALLEGGYDLNALADLTLSFLEGLEGG